MFHIELLLPLRKRSAEKNRQTCDHIHCILLHTTLPQPHNSVQTKPITLITRLGMLIFLVSIGMLIYSVVRHFMGATTTGWTSLIVSIWAIGGLQLLAIGVIGQYIGKVYLETKERPKYIVETYLSDENENSKEE